MIFYIISLASACKPISQNLTVYPTIGEQFSLPLNELFVGNNLEYHCIPDCPENVTIMNQLNQVHQQHLNYKTIGLSSNNTHFVTLTSDRKIYFYLFDKQDNNMKQLSRTHIDHLLTCFNTIFTYTNQIVIDCYYEDILQFYYLNKSTMVLMEQFINQSIPINTKILNYYANDRYYLLYAQFYDEYQILTLLEEQTMINQTTWTQGVKDFDVSNQFIYLIDASVIYQVYVNQELKFIISALNRVFYGVQIQSHNFKTFSTQCDYLLVIQFNPYQNNYLVFEAWNGSIILSEEEFGQTNSVSADFQGSFASESFLIVQLNYRILIIEIGPSSQGNTFQYNYLGYLTLYCYFDITSNIYYIFSDKIEVFLIQKPSLTIYLNYIQTDSFFILANYIQNKERCKLKLGYQIINSTDNNIYLTYNKSAQVNYGIYNTTFIYKLNQLSGPLMNVTGAVQNSNLGAFNDATLQQLNLTIQQQFMVTGIYQIWKQNVNTPNNRQILFVGATLTEIYFYDCTFLFICSLIFQESILSPINQIEITFRYPNSLLVGVNQGIDNVFLYNISNITETLNITKQYLLFPTYTQFILTYNNIILLLSNHQILIQSLESSDNLTITGEYINNLLSNQSQQQCNFNPQNIEMNTQYLSSILYINNNNSFIILVIQNTKQIIPQSLVSVDFNIYQLNIINQQLIVSYKCGQQMCFQVWNVQNLINPQYINDLPNLQMKYNWNIQSDNLFLYILNQNQTMNVLNPILSYHSSLYYQFQYTGNYFSSLSMETYSIISIENDLFQLSAILQQQFKPQIDNQLPQEYVTSTFFNFSVKNIFANSITTQNQIFSLINPFTQISFLQQNYSYNTSYEKFNINITSNNKIQTIGQILYYDISPNTSCTVQNYIEKYVISEQSCYYYMNNTSILLIFNKTLLIQTGVLIMPLGVGNCFSSIVTDNYFYFNRKYITVLPITTSYFNLTNVAQICNVSNKYPQNLFLFKFILNCTSYQGCNILNQTKFQILTYFSKIVKMESINLDQQIILGLQASEYPNIYILSLQTKENVIIVTNLRVKCDTMIWDFTVVNLLSYDVNIVFYLCGNQLRYSQLPLGENDQQLFDSQSFFLSDQTQFSQILFLDQHYFTILLLLTTSDSVSVIFTVAYNDLIHIQIQEIAQTIPPYGDFHLIQAQEQNGLILMIYYKKPELVYAIYDWKSMNLQIQNPIVMNGGLNFSSPLPQSIVMNITSHSLGGEIYEIQNGTFHSYRVSSNATLNCNMHGHKNQSLTLVAYNNFNSCNFLVELNYNPMNEWLIGLLVFVSIVFFIAMFVYWYKTKDIKTRDVFFIDEFEIEL